MSLSTPLEVTTRSQHTPAFSIGEARSLVKDLFEPKPALYWADFLLSMAVAGAAFLAVPRVGHWSLSLACYAVSVIGFYRGVLFTHELVHFRSGTFRLFTIAWNLLCGIPFLIPSKTYETHLTHHARRHYATEHDGEYLPFAGGSWSLYLMYFSQPFLMPLVAIARFGLLTPISWLSPRVRDWAHQHLSSMVIDPRFVRPLPARSELWIWRLQEVACFLVIAETAAGAALGLFPWHFIPRAYLTSVGVLMLNAIRTLGAHRYRNLTGGEMTFTEQLLDSVNVPGRSWLTALWAPVGLRFHALHHLFPAMPYHNLAEAHRRLMAHLPTDSPYRQTVCTSLASALVQLWRDTRQQRWESSVPTPHHRPLGTQASQQRQASRS